MSKAEAREARGIVEALKEGRELLLGIRLLILNRLDVFPELFTLELRETFGIINKCYEQLFSLRAAFRRTGVSRALQRDLEHIHTGSFEWEGTLPYMELRLRNLSTVETDPEARARWLIELRNGLHSVCDELTKDEAECD